MTERQSTLCECGHGQLVHIAKCHVKGCLCKRFVPKKP